MDLFKFSTLVGSVHVVDWGLDPWWGPSMLWTRVLTLGGVRPFCGIFSVGVRPLIIVIF